VTILDVRGVPAALFGAGIGTARRFEGWNAAIHQPLAIGQRIGVVQLAAASGATTIARHVSRLFATRRTDGALAVDLGPGESGLAGRLGAERVEPSEIRAGARSSLEAVTGLPLGRDDQRVLAPAAAGPDAVATWLDEAAPITRFFDATVTDFGTRHPLGDLAGVSALCDTVCLVSRADRPAAELSRSVAAAIRSLPEAPAVVLALVDIDRVGGGPARVVAAHSPDRVVRVPWDRGIASAGAPRTLAARRALLELAAAVMPRRDAEETA
jgi:hypothetical protein